MEKRQLPISRIARPSGEAAWQPLNENGRAEGAPQFRIPHSAFRIS
jgi:hypothetical protein